MRCLETVKWMADLSESQRDEIKSHLLGELGNQLCIDEYGRVFIDMLNKSEGDIMAMAMKYAIDEGIIDKPAPTLEELFKKAFPEFKGYMSANNRVYRCEIVGDTVPNSLGDGSYVAKYPDHPEQKRAVIDIYHCGDSGEWKIKFHPEPYYGGGTLFRLKKA